MGIVPPDATRQDYAWSMREHAPKPVQLVRYIKGHDLCTIVEFLIVAGLWLTWGWRSLVCWALVALVRFARELWTDYNEAQLRGCGLLSILFRE